MGAFSPNVTALLAADVLRPWPAWQGGLVAGVACLVLWLVRVRRGGRAWRMVFAVVLRWLAVAGLVGAAGSGLLALGVWLFPEASVAIEPVWPWPVTLGVSVGLTAWVVVAYRRRLAALSPGRRRLLIGLRLAALAILIFCCWRPVVQYQDKDRRQATLALVLDPSRSMTTPDGPAGVSRFEAARSILTASQPELEAIAQEATLERFEWQTEPVAVTEWSAEAAVEQSPIGQVLSELSHEQGNRRLVGIILLSDGAQRARPPVDLDPRIAAQRLAEGQIPLHTVAFGSSSVTGGALDLAADELQLPSTVFVKNRVIVKARVRAAGAAGREATVRLLVEQPGQKDAAGQTLMAVQGIPQKISFQNAEETVPVELSYVPEVAGEYRIAVEVEPLAGELVRANNRVTSYLTVQKGGINVAYFDRRRPEQKFIRQMNESPDIQVDFQAIRYDPKLPPPNLNDEWFVPGAYDVYILGDVPAAAFNPPGQKGPGRLGQLRDAVDRGAGLMMTGGVHNFGAGGYAETPLADVLPVVMDKSQVRPFDTAATPDELQPTVMTPTSSGVQHFIMRLAEPAQNRAAWGKLAPLEGATRFKAIKPLALVLAETDVQQPLLVAQDYGRGRVLAFGGDTTFQWSLAGDKLAHQQFWRQTILWLSHKEQQGDGAVWIELDQRRIRPGQPLDFRFGARDANGQPSQNVEFTAEVVGPDGQPKRLAAERRGGDFGARFPGAAEPGEYTLRVSGTQGGNSLGLPTQARFTVYEQDLELDRPIADFTLMEELSRMTGGRVVPPEQFTEFLRDLLKQGLRPDDATVVSVTLWDRWPLVALFVIMLTAEWFYRKRLGMV